MQLLFIQFQRQSQINFFGRLRAQLRVDECYLSKDDYNQPVPWKDGPSKS